MIREQQGMRLDIFRSYTSAKDTAGAIKALRKYGPEEPQLYPAALSYFTSSPKAIQDAGDELQRVLDKIDEDGLMAPLQVIQTLSENGIATVGMVKKYLRTTMERERQETANVCLLPFFFPSHRQILFTSPCLNSARSFLSSQSCKTYVLKNFPWLILVPNSLFFSEPPPHRDIPRRHSRQARRTRRTVRQTRHLHRHPLRILRRRTRPSHRPLHVQALLSPALSRHCECRQHA